MKRIQKMDESKKSLKKKTNLFDASVTTKIGETRENFVKHYYEKQGWIVIKTRFNIDVNNKVDLSCYKDGARTLFVQVKSFHKTWKNDNFYKLIDYAKKNDAIPIIARVNSSGKIYFWNPTK